MRYASYGLHTLYAVVITACTSHTHSRKVEKNLTYLPCVVSLPLEDLSTAVCAGDSIFLLLLLLSCCFCVCSWLSSDPLRGEELASI